MIVNDTGKSQNLLIIFKRKSPLKCINFKRHRDMICHINDIKYLLVLSSCFKNAKKKKKLDSKGQESSEGAA